MSFTPIKTPLVAKKLFPNYVWDIPTKEKAIYLTFDDGPTPEITEWTLDVLSKQKAKATFFCIGSNIKKNPGIFQRILNEGHIVGNHTQNHLKGWKHSSNTYLENIKEAQDIIDSKIPSPIENLFRPPYGKMTPKQSKKIIDLGYKIIMWDVLSFDWDNRITPQDCVANVISKTKEGSIVVFHDSLKASKNMQYALPKVLEYFGEKGFQFKPICFS